MFLPGVTFGVYIDYTGIIYDKKFVVLKAQFYNEDDAREYCKFIKRKYPRNKFLLKKIEDIGSSLNITDI